MYDSDDEDRIKSRGMNSSSRCSSDLAHCSVRRGGSGEEVNLKTDYFCGTLKRLLWYDTLRGHIIVHIAKRHQKSAGGQPLADLHNMPFL